MVALLAIVVMVGVLAGPVMSKVEQPPYDVVETLANSNVEIRQYQSMIVAKVKVSGERSEAASKGFRRVADYIFGGNVQAKSIAMTAPVEQQGERIAMTAPVEQQAVSSGHWHVSFIMPSEYTLETLPIPNDDQVQLAPVPAKRFAVIEFSGRPTQANLNEHSERLMTVIKAKQMETVGVIKYAFYNPPWTLPLLRRNEVMIELR